MKRKLSALLAFLLALTMMFSMTACGSKDAENIEEDEQVQASAQAEPEEPKNLAAEDTEEKAAGESEDTEDAEDAPSIVKVIEEIDEEGEKLPLQISSITLFDDGSVAIVPVDDLKKIELRDSDAEMLYPFEPSGPVADLKVLRYGNGGYRTIAAVLKDGSISVVNGRALVEDHVIAVMDNVAGRDDFVSVKNSHDEDAYYIVGVTNEDKEIVLDYSFNF